MQATRPVRLAYQAPVLFFQNKPATNNQQYFSLRTNQHQPSATGQTNRLELSAPAISHRPN
jgi:hypothetical protein